MNRLNQAVKGIVVASTMMMATGLATAQDVEDDSPLASKAGPSFDCSSDELSSIEKMVCQDKTLAEFDRQLANIYQQAKDKVKGQMLELLTAEQRGWIKGRDECWKADNKVECVSDLYHMRTAGLQARFKLVDSTGPVIFACDVPGNAELSVTFYQSDPATLIASWQNTMSLMYIEPAASGTKYQGRNTLFWEHQGEAKVKWGPESPEFKCKKK